MTGVLALIGLGGAGGSGGGGSDVTPAAIDFVNVSVSGEGEAYEVTNEVTFTGINTAITIRITLNSVATATRILGVVKNGVAAGDIMSGATLDVVVSSGDVIFYSFFNTSGPSTWSGTATITNVSDSNAVLDTFTYNIHATAVGP